MARMVRKQIVIEPEQERALEAHARALGVSQSALIRRAIDALLEDAEEQVRRREAWEFLKSEFEREMAADEMRRSMQDARDAMDAYKGKAVNSN